MITKEELLQFDDCTNNEYHRNVARLIDNRILSSYKLWPNNYIAYDMNYGQQRFVGEYTPEEKKAFEKHLDKLEKYDGDANILKDILLAIYSNPVKNKLTIEKQNERND